MGKSLYIAEKPSVAQNIAAVNDTAPLTPEEKAKALEIRSALGTNFCRRCNYCQPCAAGISISNVSPAKKRLR